MDARPIALALVAVAALVPDRADPGERFDARLESRRQALIDFRRDLHRNPELSGREKRTATLVAGRLRTLGYSVENRIGGYGVIGLLEGGRPGPIVAFRADMDAVTSSAPDPVSFRSKREGVRHICGHDVHTTIGLALAEGFAAAREELAGSVLLVFQPAEENATGARAMLAAGVFDDRKPSAIFAVHTAPMEVGTLITSPGTLMAWRDRVQLSLSGEGDLATHAARLRSRVQELSTIAPSDATGSATGDFLFVQSGPPARHADGSHRVLATITTATDTASESARSRIADAVRDLEQAGVDVKWNYEQRWVAGVTNDPAVTGRAIQSARAVLGEASVVTTDSVVPMFSEDFGSFQQVVPGTMFFLGVSNAEKGWVGMPHTPNYVADEEAIFVGARVMARVMLDALRHGAPGETSDKGPQGH